MTGEVVSIVMDIWIRNLHQILEENKIDVYLLLKYVDDFNPMVSPIREGWRCKRERDSWKITWSK